MNPVNEVKEHLPNHNAVVAIVDQKEVTTGLWKITVRLNIYSVIVVFYFDKPIEYEGRRIGFNVIIRHADFCQDEHGKDYCFILDCGIMEAEAEAKVNFRADHYQSTP